MPSGLFEARASARGRDAGGTIRLQVPHPRRGCRAREIVDPYQFGQVLSDYDLHLFSEGTHLRAWEKFGAHAMAIGGVPGVHFAVWAPNAQRVSVVGDFNRWDGRVHPMRRLVPSGVWELFVPGLPFGACYKYEFATPEGHLLEKSDPYAQQFEVPPNSASIIWHGQASTNGATTTG